MKTILAALFAVACLGATSTQDADLTGAWTVTIDGANGRTLAFTLSLTKDGGAPTLIAPNGETRGAKLAVDGRSVTIRFDLDNPAGNPVPVNLTGTVHGDAMKGTVAFDGRTVDWAAKRTSRVAVVPLSGSVRDIYTRGGYLAGAKVSITQHATGRETKLVTGPDGRFRLATVEPGTYTIAVAMPGYGSLVADNFCVAPGKPARFDAALGPDRGERARAVAPSASAVVPLPRSVPGSGAMTTSEIEQAMEFGRRSGQLKAVPLTQSQGLNRYRAGLLFTPFLRVATMEQVARAANKTFTAQEIPAPFVERLAWIVGRPETHYVYSSDMDSPAFLAGVDEIVIRPRDASDAATEIKPVWKMFLNTVCDANALESVLGNQFPRPGVVAAFPMAAIAPGNTVVFTYSTAATPLDAFRGITVSRAERRIVLTREHLQERR